MNMYIHIIELSVKTKSFTMYQDRKRRYCINRRHGIKKRRSIEDFVETALNQQRGCIYSCSFEDEKEDDDNEKKEKQRRRRRRKALKYVQLFGKTG